MGIFDSIKCFTGFHNWTPWEFDRDRSCNQTSICQRKCSKSRSRISHTWSNFEYILPKSCEQKRGCSRCDLEENRIAEHIWTQWSYLSPEKCDMSRICQRCGIEDDLVEHQWGVWEYESPTSCVQVRFCRRCAVGQEERYPERAEHQWGEPLKLDCYTATVNCVRCKETDEFKLSPAEHLWSPWQKTSETDRQRECVSCGEVEVGNIQSNSS
jgi:hypothetical protein